MNSEYEITTAETISKYAYVNDAVGRRTAVETTGAAFSADRFTLWDYNTRSELTSSKRYTGTYDPEPTSGEVTAERRLYEYDPIGNRKQSTQGTADPKHYCANELNQYKHTRSATDSCPTPTTPIESFTYDADGNLTQDGQFVYTWDGENRLIGVAPASSPVNGDKRIKGDILISTVAPCVLACRVSAHPGASAPGAPVVFSWRMRGSQTPRCRRSDDAAKSASANRTQFTPFWGSKSGSVAAAARRSPVPRGSANLQTRVFSGVRSGR